MSTLRWRNIGRDAFTSRGFHERVQVRALNGVGEWGPGDHCRLWIEVAVD